MCRGCTGTGLDLGGEESKYTVAKLEHRGKHQQMAGHVTPYSIMYIRLNKTQWETWESATDRFCAQTRIFYPQLSFLPWLLPCVYQRINTSALQHTLSCPGN